MNEPGPYPELDTPALLFDLDRMQRNIEEMAGVARVAGIHLRPHTKTHKSPVIARRQLDAGAAGMAVAKLGEAEVMADAGIDDLLVAYPIVGAAKLARLRALCERATVRVSLDSVEVAEGIGRVGGDLGRDIPVLVEVDTGHHRLGRPPGPLTVELATSIARVRGVEVAGLLTHAGHAYRCTSPDELHAVAEREGTDLVETAAACGRAGLEIREISVGSTPTARVVAGVAGVTEFRPGTYVFNDVQQMRLGLATEDTCAARILVTVVAHPSDERFVVDAGTKCFTSDGADGPPFPGRGVIAGRPELMIDFMTEEHGVGRRTGTDDVRIGDRLEIIPLHVCSSVNMFDAAVGVRGGNVAEEITIAGRGKVR
jgi:D-serine deaminase-like pyridoxal phosphate-dependent protein